MLVYVLLPALEICSYKDDYKNFHVIHNKNFFRKHITPGLIILEKNTTMALSSMLLRSEGYHYFCIPVNTNRDKQSDEKLTVTVLTQHHKEKKSG